MSRLYVCGVVVSSAYFRQFVSVARMLVEGFVSVRALVMVSETCYGALEIAGSTTTLCSEKNTHFCFLA